MIDIIQIVLVLIIVLIFITGLVRYILKVLKEYEEERFSDVNSLEEFVERYGKNNEADSNGSE